MSFREPSNTEVFLSLFLGRSFLNSFYGKYVESFGLKGNEMVLDYGSGSGVLARHIARRLMKGNGRLTCVDISEVWMKTIRKALKKYPNVEFKLGDISFLDLPNESYDVIVIHFMLHEVGEETRQKNLNILAQKLKKTGKIFIREPTVKSHGISPQEIRSLMSATGLTELEFKITKPLFANSMYAGVFVKKAKN